jgi:hypothetical protein
MRKRVNEHDVAHWAEGFLGTLDRAPDTWLASGSPLTSAVRPGRRFSR